MPLVRTWTATLNSVPSQGTQLAQARAVLRAWKDGIKAAGWTCDGSSSSTAAGMDGTDRWAADSNLVWNGAGSAHSWIVLKSPTNYPSTGKNIWLLIALSAGSGASNATTRTAYIRLVWASAAFTGGSTTADPTLPTNYREIASQQFIKGDGTTFTAGKYHVIRNTLGDFLMLFSNDSSGYFCSYLCSFQSTGAEVGDTYPWIGSSNFNNAAPGAFFRTALEGNNSAAFWIDDTPIVGAYYAANLISNGASPYESFLVGGSNITGTYPAVPVFLVSLDGSKVAFRGTLVDIAGAPSGTGIAQGTVQPASGTSLQMICGQFWVPNGNTVPLL